MKALKEVFTPLAQFNQTKVAVIVASQLLLLFIVWSFGHFTFFPKPLEVGHALLNLGSEGIVPDLITSFVFCIKSTFYAAIIAAIVSYATKIDITRYPALFITKFRFLTLVGISFFFTVVTRDSDQLKVWLLTFSVTTFFSTAFVSVIDNIPPYKFDHSRTLGLGPWRTWYEVIIRGTLVDLFDIFRQNFAMAWMMITMVEGLVRSGGGIGVLLLTKERTMSLDYIVAIQLVVLVIGISMDFIISYTTNWLFPYAKFSKK
jgi:ABC-type nitrate/sulfonate/bicarbonate transport system permease component